MLLTRKPAQDLKSCYVDQLSFNDFLERKIKWLMKKLKIEFDEKIFVPLKMQNFIGSNCTAIFFREFAAINSSN